MKTLTVNALRVEDKTDVLATSSWANGGRRLAERSVLLLLFVLPLVTTPFVTVDMFDLPKSVLQHIGTIVALAALGIRLMVTGRASLVRTKLDWPLLAFVAAIIIATFNSITLVTSLFGEYGRFDGLITTLNYVILFLLAVNLFTEWAEVRFAVAAIATGGSVVALIGILEALGFTPYSNQGSADDFAGRILSTLGNPDFLGGYLALVIPLTIGLLLTSESRRARILWGAAFVAMFYTLILTYTRGAWLGFAASLPVFLIAKEQVWRYRGPLAILGVASLILIFSTQWAGAHNTVKTVPQPAPDDTRASVEAKPVSALEARLRSFTQMAGSSGEIRLQLWGSTLELIEDNPIFGTGPNTFQPAIMKYLKPEYMRGEGYSASPDRAHNQYLQWAATTGVVGLGAFLAVMAAFVLSIASSLRRGLEGKSKALLVAILAGWVGYAVQNFFLFDTVDGASIWWALMGLGVSLSLANGERTTRRIELSLPRWTPLTGVVLILAGGIFLAVLAVKPLVADRLFWLGQVKWSAAGENVDSLDVAIGDYSMAVDWFPYERYYIQRLAAVYALRSQFAIGEVERRKYLDKAVETINVAIRNSPRHSDLYYARGGMYEGYGRDRLSEAYADYRKAAELRPYDYEANVALAALASRFSDTSLAIIARKRALEVFPHDRQATFGLATNYAMLGRLGEAEEVIDKALSVSPEDTEARLIMANIYQAQGRWNDAVDLYRAILDKQPDNEEAKAGLEQAENRSKAPPLPAEAVLPLGHPR